MPLEYTNLYDMCFVFEIAWFKNIESELDNLNRGHHSELSLKMSLCRWSKLNNIILKNNTSQKLRTSHSIIQIQNNVTRDWQYYVEHSSHSA